VADDKSYDLQLAEALAEFYDDPLGYVLFCFPWDTESSIQLVEFPEKYRKRYPGAPKFGPDEWACDFLWDLGEEIRSRGFDGRRAVDPIRFATVSGHGIGKSVLVAWLVKFIMDTRPFARGVVTANTAEQLRTKTWAEVGKWHKLSLTVGWFDYSTGKGAMSLSKKDMKESWRCDAQTSREENSESFAGLHAANSTPFYIFDEASAIPDKIFEVREGGTTDGEPMVFDFGNPTRNSGRFYEQCEGKFRHLWRVRSIDSRSVAITNKKRLQEWVDTFGEDSDFVRVRVRGVFPYAGSAQFIPTGDVEEAMERQHTQAQYYANLSTNRVVLGVDVARFGEDDSVIYPRVGDDARSWEVRRFNGLRTTELAEKVKQYVAEFVGLGMPVAAIFVDGGGVGGGVIDILLKGGYPVVEVPFGGSPTDKKEYRFKVDEMWDRMKKAIAGRLLLPRPFTPVGDLLKAELTGREYAFTKTDQINLESKSDMKDRGLGSPDIADALALTFAQDVADAPGFQPGMMGNGGPPTAIAEYNPHDARW
jgi:hypothetical protein